MVVTTRSDRGGSTRKVFLTLGCKCSGTIKPKKVGLKRKGTTSRKFQCPFKLKGRHGNDGTTWGLTVLCGIAQSRAQQDVGGACIYWSPIK